MQKKFKIKKGDTVKVIAGAALGQEGTILEVDNKKDRVYFWSLVKKTYGIEVFAKPLSYLLGNLSDSSPGNCRGVSLKTPKPLRMKLDLAVVKRLYN